MNNPDLMKKELCCDLLYYIIQNHNEDQEESQSQHFHNLYYKLYNYHHMDENLN